MGRRQPIRTGMTADKLTPSVTVVAQDPAAIGATAAQLLLTRINEDTPPPRDVLLLTRLIARVRARSHRLPHEPFLPRFRTFSHEITHFLVL